MDSTAPIDREKTCPLLLRCFWKPNRANAPFEYKNKLPSSEVQIYTWRDATLREISDLLKGAIASARDRNSTLEFSLVYLDKSGETLMKKV